METHVNHSLLNRAGNAAADDAADQEEREAERGQARDRRKLFVRIRKTRSGPDTGYSALVIKACGNG